MEKINWKAPADWLNIKCIDMHTGGEPLRIPIEGLPVIEGNTILEKRNYFKKHFDSIRTGLMFEPRGHADMYGAILSEASTAEADFDVFFIHNEGYSTMCGHAIIALTKFAFETGFVKNKNDNRLQINVPAGTIYAEAVMENGVVVESSFRNVPSYLYLKEKRIEVAGIGEVIFDVAFGGAFYAIVDASSVGLSMKPTNYAQLIDYGRRIKKAVMNKFSIAHPVEEDLSFLYGTIFTGPAEDAKHHSRNVCIFAEGELDRSATGSGVSARAALHVVKGELAMNQSITIESILGSTMRVKAVEQLDYFGFKAVVPEVAGMAWFSGINDFCFDPADPWKEGFIFR